MIRAVVRPVRRRAEPDVPIQFCRQRRRLFRPGAPLRTPAFVSPRIVRQAAPGIHLAHLADGAVPDPFTNRPQVIRRVALDAHLRHQPQLLRRLGQQAGFIYIVRERFLAIDMFAGLHGGHGNQCVRVIRRGDKHRLNVFLLVEHLAVVRVKLRVGVFLERMSRVIVVHITECHDVLRLEGLQIRSAHPTDADAGDVDFLARRGLTCATQHVPGENGDRRSHRSRRQKATAIHASG